MIKASAGGGGRGIRMVGDQDMAEFERLVCRKHPPRRKAAFGDGGLYIEKIIVERARHIEVQVLGRRSVMSFHCFERECSLQRRRQKVWEEAPAATMPASHVRERPLCEAAVASGKASVGYRGAGTLGVSLRRPVTRQLLLSWK